MIFKIYVFVNKLLVVFIKYLLVGKLIQRVTYADVRIWQLAAFASTSTKNVFTISFTPSHHFVY
jgi:hypothetical protein